jgi:hypothetical protein
VPSQDKTGKTRLVVILSEYIIVKKSNTEVDFPSKDMVIGVANIYAISLNEEQMEHLYSILKQMHRAEEDDS